MKLSHLLFALTSVQATIPRNVEDCLMPDDLKVSRVSRLHHLCESNQNPYFAIETHDDFYCIFYITLGISLFGAETKFEIKVDGNYSYEQV